MISEEAKSFVGKAALPMVGEIERGAVRRYADAVGNDNPFYHDEEYAKGSRYRDIMAPPGFFGWPIKRVKGVTGHPDTVKELQEVLARGGFPRILDGGIEYEFYLPVRAGDTLVVSVVISDRRCSGERRQEWQNACMSVSNHLPEPER
jgi:acyl dehydratase